MPTTLATYGAINGQDLDRCPRVDHERVRWVHRDTGEVRFDSCRTLTCEFCFPKVIQSTAMAIASGGTSGPPTSFIRFSLDNNDWPRIRQKMADLPRLLKRQGYAGWQHSYVVHQGGRGRFHLHALGKGATVPTRQLERTWGSGVHQDQIYAPLGAASYLFHDLTDLPRLRKHLDLNGGRPQHNSRHYFGTWNLRETRNHLAPHSDDWVRVQLS